jgi:hypothetical protein
MNDMKDEVTNVFDEIADVHKFLKEIMQRGLKKITVEQREVR